ncbi:hypothetical protein EVAR_7476_1 [Eumeta japonica]|uniref:Uncharacterized protein n=1 Tax=Eumeta variegata TaxID=151549 RepID=A0A4C1Y3W3_EUMVA|nr:hypothetical protein EVAR_7476_1 [Eumeta japonica]
MDTHNPKGFVSALPASCVRIGHLTERIFMNFGGARDATHSRTTCSPFLQSISWAVRAGDRPPTVCFRIRLKRRPRTRPPNSRREMGHRTRRMSEPELVLVHQYWIPQIAYSSFSRD